MLHLPSKPAGHEEENSICVSWVGIAVSQEERVKVDRNLSEYEINLSACTFTFWPASEVCSQLNLWQWNIELCAVGWVSFASPPLAQGSGCSVQKWDRWRDYFQSGPQPQRVLGDIISICCHRRQQSAPIISDNLLNIQYVWNIPG